MKYPQLVPMPSAVQNWLDEQLEARGIDAVVYTRYILSLLQRDSLDLLDDPLSLSPSKEKEAGRRGRRRGRRDEYWNVWDSEQLKRSAAVECLMSASDQKFGIEKLVDELCAKLKEIQSEGENSVHLELSQSPHSNKTPQPPSPKDQIKKYYEAFPPLDCKLRKSDNRSVIPEIASVWNGKKTLATSLGTEGSDTKTSNRLWAGRENMKLRSQGSWEKESYGFAWNMAEERLLGCEEAGCEPLRVLHYNQQNRIDTSSLACRRLYERQAEGDESLGTEILEGDDLDCPERTVDDGKLAQLIAKFDHNIEALWNADDQGDDVESELELPVDLNELLSSPSGEKSPVEVQCSNRTDLTGQAGNSFIHSGTNITNSIWSDNPSHDGSIEHESFVVEEPSQPLSIQEVDESGEGNAAVDNDDVKVDSPMNIIPGDYVINTFKSDVLDSYRNLHRQQEIFLNQHYDSLELGSIFNFAPKEESTASRNRFENFPPVFNNMAWGLNYPLREITRGIAIQALSEMEEDSEHGAYTNGLGHISRPVGQPNSLHGSFTALNHNSEDSSFSIVVPRQEAAPFSAAVEAAADQSVPTGGEDAANPNPDGAVEEEDLLTSSRTHFRPIRQDSSDSHGGNVGYYADGTTFMIPNNFEKVSFKRSDSGTLYLETEAGVGPPRKYMEYKEKEPYGGRYRIYVLEAMDDCCNFVPKFQVCQNEKCCQTEVEEENTITSDEEVDPKRSRQDIPSIDETEEFFFPGDDRLVAKLINDIDNDDGEDANSSSCSSCNLNGDGGCENDSINPRNGLKSASNHKESDEWSNSIKICFKCNNNNNILAWRSGWLKDGGEGKLELWHDPTTDLPSWSDIWSNCADTTAKPCESCALARGAGAEDVRSLQYSRLREELSQDGEQLLSDLSYFQHLYLGSDWPDDGNAELAGKEHVLEKVACLSPADQPSQELSLYAENSTNVATSEQTAAGRGKCVLGCVPGKLLGVAQLPTEVREAGCKHNERPFSISIISKDRKRRHSASQRACALPWDMATVSCRVLVADAACLKGIACPLHAGGGSAYALRPVTL